MIIRRSQNTLIIRDTAGLFWFLGLLFVFVGSLAMLGPLGLFTNNDEISLRDKVITFFLGCCATGAGIYVFYTSPFSSATFDSETGELSLRKQWIAGKTVQTYPLTDIASVHLIEQEDDEGSPVYQIHLKLLSGDTIKLSQLWLHDAPGCENAAVAVQQLLNVPLHRRKEK